MGSTGMTNLNRAAAGAILRLLLSVAVLLAGGATISRGQSALDGFDPNANGAVRVVVRQPDGRILIGGDFTSLAPNGGVSVTRNRMARLNPDGTLDATFNPNVSSVVLALALQADGKILAGGAFTTIAGQPRHRIARLNPDGTLDTGFNPGASNAVYSIALQADGRILVGGDFTSIGGQTRRRIARLDPTTGLPDSFDPNADGIVFSFLVQADGRIVAGGNFTSIGGQMRNRIARLDPTTGLADAFNPNANNNVLSLAAQPDGNILAGGNFTSMGGQTRNRIARLDPTTGLPDTFNPDVPGISGAVNCIRLQPDGRILVGGSFTIIGGFMRNNIARLNPDGTLHVVFNPNANSFVNANAIVVQPDGKILVGGGFATIGGATRNNLARLETDGRADRMLNVSIESDEGEFPSVSATAVQPDGKILIGGTFRVVLGVRRNNLARLNTDGTLDSLFNPNPDTSISSIALQADGKILVGGNFSTIGEEARNSIARLEPNGVVDTGFDPDAGEFQSVSTIALQADGKILLGGSFSSIGGQTRHGIARLNPNGTADIAFNPDSLGIIRINCIAVQADGKVLVGGEFTRIGGQARTNIARLDSTTGLADSFNPNVSGAVVSLAVQPDGKILVGGPFQNVGGQARNGIARLEANGVVETGFNPDAGESRYVSTIALQADGKILVSGFFSSIGGQTRNNFARLDPTTGLADSFHLSAGGIYSMTVQEDGKILVGGSFTSIGGEARTNFARLINDTVAAHHLTVAQTAVTWIRSGSSPQFSRVTFEDSTDGVNYNFLGNATASGNNWTLTSLNLSVGQNLFIRARGHYRSGNRSESIQEAVRNVVVVAQPILNIQRSGNTAFLLSWTTNAIGFTLEANTSLNTNVWSVVSPAPVVSGANNIVTNVATGAQKFYRLSRQ